MKPLKGSRFEKTCAVIAEMFTMICVRQNIVSRRKGIAASPNYARSWLICFGRRDVLAFRV
jgi:hypothetical protein